MIITHASSTCIYSPKPLQLITIATHRADDVVQAKGLISVHTACMHTCHAQESMIAGKYMPAWCLYMTRGFQRPVCCVCDFFNLKVHAIQFHKKKCETWCAQPQ